MENNKKCEHLFLPVAYTYDLKVYGVKLGEDDEAYLDNRFLIVKCENCDKEGFCLIEEL